jgi:hypothetical protein
MRHLLEAMHRGARADVARRVLLLQQREDAVARLADVQLRIGDLGPLHAIGELIALDLRAEEDRVDRFVLRPPFRIDGAHFLRDRAHVRLPFRDRGGRVVGQLVVPRVQPLIGCRHGIVLIAPVVVVAGELVQLWRSHGECGHGEKESRDPVS